MNIIWKKDRNEHRAKKFVENVIDSINQKTEYYKKHCTKDAIEKIEENIYEITENYKIRVSDYESAFYEYEVTFDNKNTFYVSVVRSHNDFKIIHFIPIFLK